MRREQAILLVVAACNILVMLMFPPYDSLVLARGGPQSFDAFYFALDAHPGKLVNSDLLLMELYWIVINSAVAWLLLRGGGKPAAIKRRTAVIAIAAINLALVFAFPPFENYASALRAGNTYFDGFYFAFGDKWQRHFFIPLLYMEVLWILINGALMWLLMRDTSRQQASGGEPGGT